MYHPSEDEVRIDVDGQEAGVIALAEFLQKLHAKWQPHPGQVPIGWALFYGGFKDIFACCGRNFGKTEVIAYASTRYANERPKSENYIFGPVQKQVKEILWASKRIQEMSPAEFVESTNSVEMRVTFNNGSFIKLDGSDNVEAYRGIKPKGLSTYDERKDMKKGFLDAYDPNRAAFDSPAIHIGTPPEFHNDFVDTMEIAKKNHMKDWFFLHAPTSSNPYISKEWLEKKRRTLIDLGDEETWLREYEAIYVKGGKRHIFPQFLKYKPRPLDELTPKDLNKWQLVVHNDPATTSTFGVMFSLHNPYTKKLILVDEIYESEMAKMTTRQIWQQIDPIVAKWVKLGVRPDWVTHGYDEAAAWFMNESTEVKPGTWLTPTTKNQYGVESGIGMVRDIFRHQMIEVADHLKDFISEMENYIKDEKGKIPKENDHQINNLQYTLQLLGYKFEEEPEMKEPTYTERPRYYSYESEFETENPLAEIGDF